MKATILATSPSEIKEAYSMCQTIPSMRVVRLENKIRTQHETLFLNFIYEDKIIGEIQLRCKHEAVQ